MTHTFLNQKFVNDANEVLRWFGTGLKIESPQFPNPVGYQIDFNLAMWGSLNICKYKVLGRH